MFWNKEKEGILRKLNLDDFDNIATNRKDYWRERLIFINELSSEEIDILKYELIYYDKLAFEQQYFMWSVKSLYWQKELLKNITSEAFHKYTVEKYKLRAKSLYYLVNQPVLSCYTINKYHTKVKRYLNSLFTFLHDFLREIIRSKFGGFESVDIKTHYFLEKMKVFETEYIYPNDL